MKNLSLFLLLIVTVLFACSQKPNTPTHSLELLSADAAEPTKINISLTSENDIHSISIEFPDGALTTEFIALNDSILKFQLAQIRNNILVDIQFLGKGSLSESVEGEFKAFLDFKPREDVREI